MKTKLIPILALTGLALSALPATAQITIVNDDNTTFTNVVPDGGTPGTNNLEANPWTVSFDAGLTANKLIVTLSSETGSGGPPSITYNGVPLTRVPGTVNQRSFGIWYLDNPFTGGAADLVINMTSYGVVNGIGFGVVSLSGAAPGSSGGISSNGTAVTLTTTVADSLIVSNYTSNVAPESTAATPTVPSGYSPLYTSNNIGSAQGAAAYLNSVAAGSQTVTYAQTGTLSGHSTTTAAFVPASAAPVLVGVSPVDNAINVAIGANLVANFSEPVVAGTGDVELWQVGGGSPVESFDVASSLSGQTLTISPTSNLTPGGEYYVLIPATALVDTSGGDAFAGISDPNAWNFKADGTAPTLVSVNPAGNAPAVLVSSNLVATFSEPVFAGTGNVELWQDGGGSPLESFDVSSSPLLTFSGETLTINPTAELTPSTGYHIRMDATAVVDASNFAFAGISDPTAWNFTADGTPPTLVTLSPVDGASFVSVNANLVATFSENLVVGTGSIELWKTGGGSPVETFDLASSAQLTVAGATLTINPTANLDYTSGYDVIIPSTAFKDGSGNFFSGLTVSTAWKFTTAPAPPAITFLNSVNFINTTTLAAPQTYTKEFDPNDDADALVVILATEVPVANVFNVTWDGVPMLPVNSPNSNNPVCVFYLNNPTNIDLANVDVTVSRTTAGGNINGFGMTVMALNNVGDFPIAPTAFLNRGGANSVLPIDLNVDSDGSFVVAGFNSSDGSPAAGGITASANLTQLLRADLGSLQGYFGYDADVPAGINTYDFNYAGAASFSSVVAFAAVPTAPPTNTFANWISNPAFGLAVADQDLGDDPDGDGTGNCVENFFGTHPGTFTQGLLVGIKSENTFTFTHPQNATPASDLTASYRWSKDLASFLASGAADGAGTTVTFTTQANTPSPGFTTVTATVTGTATSNLFVRVNVTQP